MVSSLTSSRPSRRTSAEPTMPRWPATKTVLPSRSNGVFAIGHLTPCDCQIARHHFLDQLIKTGLRFPAKLLPRLAGIADQKIDFGGAEIGRIDANQYLAGLPVGAGLLDALAAPLDAAADLGECQFDEFAHRTGLAGRQHEIAGLGRLQDHVHALDIVLGVAPIAFGVE